MLCLAARLFPSLKVQCACLQRIGIQAIVLSAPATDGCRDTVLMISAPAIVALCSRNVHDAQPSASMCRCSEVLSFLTHQPAPGLVRVQMSLWQATKLLWAAAEAVGGSGDVQSPDNMDFNFGKTHKPTRLLSVR